MIRQIELGELITPAKLRRAGDEELPILSMTMHDGLVDQADKFKKRIASSDTSPYKRVLRDQLVVGFPIDEGVLSFQTLYDEAIVSPAYDVWDIRLPRQVIPSFLERALRSPRALSFYRSKLQSTTARRRTIPDDLFLSLPIALPDVSEQIKINTVLDKTESLRRKRQEALRLADELLRAVFVDMYGDPTENPKGWPIFPMGEVIEFKGGSQPPKDTFIHEPRAGYVRLVQIRDFKTNKYKTYIPESLAKRSFDETDVMVARYGPPVFQILRGLSGSYNVALMKAQPKANVSKDFVFWLLQLPKYQQAVISNSERTAGQTGVNLDFLNALSVPLPPVSYQRDIIEVITKISSLVSKQRQILVECDKQLAALQATFFS
jgi:restriction endonuclease S subunit